MQKSNLLLAIAGLLATVGGAIFRCGSVIGGLIVVAGMALVIFALRHGLFERGEAWNREYAAFAADLSELLAHLEKGYLLAAPALAVKRSLRDLATSATWALKPAEAAGPDSGDLLQVARAVYPPGAQTQSELLHKSVVPNAAEFHKVRTRCAEYLAVCGRRAEHDGHFKKWAKQRLGADAAYPAKLLFYLAMPLHKHTHGGDDISGSDLARALQFFT